MPNLYNKLMAKDMPGAAPAPTARQMVAAPMGLRSAMKRYAEGGETPPPPRPPEEEARRPMAPETPYGRPMAPETPYGLDPRLEKPRQEPIPESRPETRPNPATAMPEIYPQDYAGPRTSRPQQPQGPRTSYRQNEDGTLTEIGYDGQPISGYTPEQLAMQNETTGATPSEFQYVWNGAGYDKVRTGGITMDDGTFIAGADNGQGGVDIGGPAFFAKYANDPITMARLREMYGFTGAEPEYRQPQIGYNPMENVAPQIPFNADDVPINGYNEPEVNYRAPNPQQDEPEYERLNLLRRAISGQGLGSNLDSQKIAQLLRSLGYSK